jgi:L-ascorbate metabolism protein UlaG (beta-lactamase superfamily)
MAERLNKLQQLWRVVRASYSAPMTGTPQVPPRAAAGETALTFIGHSSFLVQMAGRALLVDPVFAKRLVIMRRFRRAGVRIADLPPIDAVLLTHAHMDHLNLPSLRGVIRAMRKRGLPAPMVIVPRGVEDLVAKLGFSAVHTLQWWQSFTLGDITITHTPAKHWGARMWADTHRGFGGYMLAASGAPTVYHSGDTAYFDGFHEIAARLRPQIALLPIGAYSPDNFRAVHTSPEDALQAFQDLRAETMVPMHFGTFKLSFEPMDEPLPRLLRAAEAAGIAEKVHPLREGETWVVRV